MIETIISFVKDTTFTQDFAKLISLLSFYLVFCMLIGFIKDSKTTPYDASIIYFSKKYVRKDKLLRCCHCKEYFNVYNGTKIQCPKNHKHKIFIVNNKDCNILEEL